MNRILTILGVILLVIAAIYFLVPADQLPSFVPGHVEGSPRIHIKHGAIAGVLGLILIGLAVWSRRARA